MKRFIASRNIFVGNLICIISMLCCELMIISTLAVCPKETFTDAVICVSIASVFVGAIIVYAIIQINRGSCIIGFDKTKDEIYRKGLIFGFYCSVKLSDIKVVVIDDYRTTSFYSGHKRIVIIDNKKRKYDNDEVRRNDYFSILRKESYIGFAFNSKNLHWIRQIWNGDIETIRRAF